MLMRASRSTWIAIFLAVTLAHAVLIGWLVYLNPVLFFAHQSSDVIYPSLMSADASSGKILLSPATTQAIGEQLSGSPQANEPKQETPQETRQETPPVQLQQPVPEVQPAPDALSSSEVRTTSEARATTDKESVVAELVQSIPTPQSNTPASTAAPGSIEIQTDQSSVSSVSSAPISKDTADSSGRASSAQWVSRLDYADGPPTPVYPPRARQAGHEGKVILRVTINSSGQTESIEVKTSSNYSSLDEAAKEAVRRVRFRPYTSGGVAMRAMADIPFEFKLNPQ